jgi:hypothetical protein
LPAYRAESCSIKRPDDIKQEWLDLQDRSDCSYFQSWGWIGTWLEQIAIDLKPIAVKVWSDNTLVGIGLFVSKNIKRHIIIGSKAMFLNEYPFEGKNMVIEYNGLLAARDNEKAVYSETIEHLLKEYAEHDEFYFGAVEQGSCSDYLITNAGKGVDNIVREESLSWSVDLASVPEGVEGYLGSLSKNRRGQVQRAIRLYQQPGLLQIEEAQSREQALDFFDRLKVLHTERWQAAGKQGSFANPRWENFHRSVIHNRFNDNEIQLLKVHNGHDEIGYLYNFSWRKHVYVLQTGFGSSKDKRLMPGYVVHVLAIAHNKEKGMATYDLMHGDSLYKQILCNQSHKLCWIVIRRQQMKFVLEKLAADMAGICRRITGFKAE